MVCTVIIATDVAAIVGSHFGRPNDTVHLSNVGCFGDELTLGACGFTKLDIGDAQLYPSVAGVTCRARSFVLSPVSAPSTTSTSAIVTPTSQGSVGGTGSVTNTVIILAVVVIIAVVAAIV